MGKDRTLEIIKTEIERRKKTLHSTLFNDEYNDFLSFLSTLEAEECVKLLSSVDNYPKNICPPSVECEKGMREPLESEKQMNQELEAEMDKFFETMPVLEHENIFEDTFKNIARHFAQWGAEHAKK